MLQAKTKIKIYAFEPVNNTFAMMKKNLACNGYHEEMQKDIMLYNIGFYTEKKKVKFFVPNITGAASICENQDEVYHEGIKRIECNLEVMDDFCRENEITRIDFMKCDVEGAEKFVFAGGKKILASCKPVVFAEMLRKHAKKFGYHPNEIIEMMRELGYRCFKIQGNKLCAFFHMDEETVETNFFFLHSHQHRDQIKKFTR